MCNFVSGHIVCDKDSKDWGKVLVVTGIHHEEDRADSRLAKYDGQLAAWETVEEGSFDRGFRITHDSGNMLPIEDEHALKALLADWAKDRDMSSLPGYDDWKAGRIGIQGRRIRRSKTDPIERWLNQAPHGRTGRLAWKRGNVSYDGDSVYSYGWWPMARVVDWVNKVSLYRDETYSASTSNHQAGVRDALESHGFTVIRVANLDPIDHEANLQYYEGEISAAIEGRDRARMDWSKEMWRGRIDNRLAGMQSYIDFYGLDVG